MSICGGTVLLIVVIVLAVTLLGGEGDDGKHVFNPRDVQETARWAGNILKPLDTAMKIENGVVRADTLRAEMEKIKSLTGPLAGQEVSWEVNCQVGG
jgi:hypothetical protein